MKIMQKHRFVLCVFLVTAALLVMLCAVSSADSAAPDYSDPGMWAYYGSEEGTSADVFFIAPTNVSGDTDHLNADLTDSEQVYAIQWGIAMEAGIYNTQARFFAPYYRQMTLAAYALDDTDDSPYLEIAEQDVLSAFAWYLENENDGHPIVIAGFSQGAQLGLSLLKAYADNDAFRKQFVAAYLIGWRVTDEDLQECPALHMAQGETDTGVIVCFDCEAESVTGTIIVPEGTFTYSINPLNWVTDSTPASKELNTGAAFPGKDGSIKSEIPQLCGAYIDPVRGALKVTDVTSEEYPPVLSIFPDGAYHIYDYQFFYRNLQANVENRIDAWLNAQEAE